MTVASDATIHMRDFRRELVMREEAAGTTYRHPVICALEWVDFPRGVEHHNTTTTNPYKVTCIDCQEAFEQYADDIDRQEERQKVREEEDEDAGR